MYISTIEFFGDSDQDPAELSIMTDAAYSPWAGLCECRTATKISYVRIYFPSPQKFHGLWREGGGSLSGSDGKTLGESEHWQPHVTVPCVISW